jgi:hypothetical protein
MKRLGAAAAVTYFLFAVATFQPRGAGTVLAQVSKPEPAMKPPASGASPAAAAPASAGLSAAAAVVDSFAAERDSLMNEVLKSIAGRENAPAESVFKDIRVLKGMPAGRIPRIMNLGYGKSLGVGCKHCHVVGEWAKEDKVQKQVARDMSALVNTLNTELLPKIKNLKSERPTVNCTTCHRGAKKPALQM